MAKNDSGATDLKNKQLLDLANLTASYFQAKKVKDLLLSEIRKCTKEMEHLGDRAAVIEGQIHQALEDMEDTGPRVIEAKQKLLEALALARSLEEETTGIEDIQTNLQERRSSLPQLREQVSSLREHAQRKLKQWQDLQTQCQIAEAGKKKLEEEIGTLQETLAQQEQEISIMETTRDLMVGQVPGDFALDVFVDLQTDVETNFDDYVAEVKDKVAALGNEIESIKARLHQEAEDKAALSRREEDLHAAIRELDAYTPIHASKDSVIREISSLEKQQAELNLGIEGNQRELQELESEVLRLDAELQQAREREQDVSQRLGSLQSKANELDRIGNLPEEIEVLKKRAGRLEIDVGVNTRFRSLTTQIREDAHAMNTSLKMATAEYREVFGKLERVMSSLEENAEGLMESMEQGARSPESTSVMS